MIHGRRSLPTVLVAAALVLAARAATDPGAAPAAIRAPAPVPAVAPADAGAPAVLDFARDVRPLLSDRCLPCHGPDEHARQADLRLDRREDVLDPRPDGERVVAPGDPRGSALWRRITSADPGERMPPPRAGPELSEAEIETLRRWIEQGAAWSTHWAFEPPRAHAPPDVARRDWPRDPLDAFVLARLEREGLLPAPEADRATLLRRVTLDLTGLPPTLDELDAFLADEAPDAYERAVDRLLASPHYGERMAVPWLDAARYADTNGYHRDAVRTMWLWRDGVVDAFNANLPYDAFVVEQLAGDQLPGATVAQQIASGFNRNHMINDEGGAIPEEYQVEYVVDRVRTTGTVFMGLTLGCAQCHDHKYDPISQREYYRFYAFFDKLPEKGLDGTGAPAEPSLEVPTADQLAELARLEQRLAQIDAEMAAPRPELEAAEAAWADALAAELSARWTPLDPRALAATGGATLGRLDDLSVLAAGENPDVATYTFEADVDATGLVALRLEVLKDPSFAHGSVARTTHGNFVVSEVTVRAGSRVDPARVEDVALVAAIADYSQQGYHASRMIDGDPATGWAVDGDDRFEDRAAILVARAPFGFEGGTTLTITMRQEFGTQHTIGRFRWSASDDSTLATDGGTLALSDWSLLGPWPGDPATLLDEVLEPERALDLNAAYGEAGLRWSPRPDWVDGPVQPLEGERSAFLAHRTITTDRPRTLTLALGSDDALAVALDGTRVLARDVRRPAAPGQDTLDLTVPPGRHDLLLKVVNDGGPAGLAFAVTQEAPDVPNGGLARALAAATDARSEEESATVRDAYRREHWPPWGELMAARADALAQRDAVRAATPRLMVMRDEPGMRTTHVLERGLYDRPGEAVTAGVPAFLPPLPRARAGASDAASASGAAGASDTPGPLGADPEPTRLDLARWLVAPDHPLTARVAVNRIWQTLFGRGLVETVEDFGAQGSPPSHPELLDDLAVAFVRSGWDTKALVRRIVTSSTYRQSSRVSPELLARDPDGRLLARAPRPRLDAEFVRDQALALGGLLVRDLEGPPVRPYQPPGLWEEVTFRNEDLADSDFYTQDTGAKLYRRSLYTFWKRSLPPPNMQTFDAPNREVCIVRRSRTNTPLQALVLMNDPTFVEAARALAQRVLTEETLESARLVRAFRCVTARAPDDAEVDALAAFLDARRAEFAADEDAARALLTVGESMRDESLAPAEHAAWTLVCSLLLNLDEALTRG